VLNPDLRTVAAEGDPGPEPAETSDRQWMTRGVGGIGAASFLADVGNEVPTALMASLVTGTRGAPASAFGLIEGISDGLAGAAGSSAPWPTTSGAAA
jgi:hypothetical protein